jgi:hypothetical protein
VTTSNAGRPPSNAATQSPANAATAASNNGAAGRTNPGATNLRPNPEPTTPAAADKPWMTLALVSISLIGSLSANFFLGWSYVDARQKYQTLVRKTADKFRRAAEAA